MSIAGARPKLTQSLKESSSLPIEDTELSKRATNQSQKSKTAAKAMNMNAIWYPIKSPYCVMLLKAYMHAIQPDSRLRHVIVLGILFFIDCSAFILCRRVISIVQFR